MIDYLELKVPCRHAQFGETHGRIDGNDVNRRWRKWETLKGPKTGGVVNVRSIGGGADVLIKGNPAEYFQGHNLFGTSRTVDLAVDWIIAVLQQLNIRPSGDEIERWILGNVQVRRVDIAENFRLSSARMVRSVIREEAFCLMEQGRSVSTYPKFKTIYYQQYSRRWAVKLYDKGAKPGIKAAISKKTVLRKLEKYAQGKVRVELCLRKPELSRKGLDVLSAWRELQPRKILKARLSRLHLTSSRLVPVASGPAHQLKSMERVVAQVHNDGHDLKDFLDPRTLKRYRKRFAELGLTFDRKRLRGVGGVTLFDALSEISRVKGIPAWARAAGLFYAPSSRA